MVREGVSMEKESRDLEDGVEEHSGPQINQSSSVIERQSESDTNEQDTTG